MKLRLPLLCALLCAAVPAWGEEGPVDSIELSKVERYQAEQWLRLARDFWAVGDYATMRDFCEKILRYYGGTPYAAEARKYLLLTTNPKKNKWRKFVRENPGVFLGP